VQNACTVFPERSELNFQSDYDKNRLLVFNRQSADKYPVHMCTVLRPAISIILPRFPRPRSKHSAGKQIQLYNSCCTCRPPTINITIQLYCTKHPTQFAGCSPTKETNSQPSNTKGMSGQSHEISQPKIIHHIPSFYSHLTLFVKR
jgi:hypothetical protein